MAKDESKKTSIVIAAIICATIVTLSCISAFVFVSQQEMKQRQEENKARIEAEDKDRLIREYNACIEAAKVNSNDYARSYSANACQEKYEQ